MSTTSTEINAFFHENGYYLATGVFNAAEIGELETDFDRIVYQLTHSGEEVTGRWGGAATDKIAPSAEGRIFSGMEGKARGLVDELGGLGAAIARARVSSRARSGRKLKWSPASPGWMPA